MPVSGHLQRRRGRLGGHRPHSDLHMGQPIPFEINCDQMKTMWRLSNGAYNRKLCVLVFYGTYAVLEQIEQRQP